MSYHVEIVESSSSMLEVSSSVGDNQPTIEVLQDNISNIYVYHDISLLPSDFVDNIKTTVDEILVGNSGIVVSPLSSGIILISSSGLQPSGNYSVVGHSHTVLDISDFNSGVSGLLPVKNVSAGSGINISSNSGDFTIAVTGQFGLTSEQVDDRISELLDAGSYTYINYDDNANTLTISVTGLQPSGNYSVVGHEHIISDVSGLQGALDNKQPSGNYALATHYHTSSDIGDFNSAVSGLLPVKNVSAGSGIGISVNNNDYTISVTGTFGLTGEQVDDRVGGLLQAGSYININYNDLNDTLTISASGVQPSGNYSIDGHTHTSSNITDFNSSVNSVVSGVYAPLYSPSFSGTPTVPTAPSGTNSTQAASTQFVRNEISNLINSAPSTLDTLNELASALGNDPNFATTIASGLGQKANVVHSHSSSDITDFNSSVSGLLPVTNITASSGIVASYSGTTYNLSSSGLAYISGANFNSLSVTGTPVSVSGHAHVYSDITNFSSGVADNLTTTLLAGNYINIVYDNVLDTLTISTSGLQPSGNYSTVDHTHTSSNITDFNSSVSGLLPVKNVLGSGYVSVSSSSGNYTVSVTGLQPSGSYASLVHTHSSSDITNFNSSVSGLLPTVSGSGYVNSSFNNNIYTISVTGLQPSGNYSVVGHTHTSSNITDFNSSVSGLLPVKDISAGSGISVSSSSGIYTINSIVTSVDEANKLVTNVFNKTGSPIPKFSAVYINGGQGDQPTIDLAIASGESTSSKTYAITAETIGNMSAGKVIVEGALTGVNTDVFNPTAPTGDVNGTVLYLSPTVPGGVTTTKPSAPNHLVSVGTIVRTHQNEGVVEVRIQNGFELQELHNVAISGVAAGQFLQYNGSGLWVPSSSGNFSTLSVNGTGVSLSGHTHTSSHIIDFNSSVSGLLPVTNIVGGTNISVVPSGTIFTVSVSGSLGLTTEEVDDRISNLLVAGSGINLSYDDNANTLTITATKNSILSDVVGSTNYIGIAPAGSSTASSVWTIKRTIYANDGSVSSTASATNVKWDDRLTASYS